MNIVVGLVVILGGLFFIWAPRTHWHRVRLEYALRNHPERLPRQLADRVRWYTMIGVSFLVLGFLRLVAA